MFLLNRGVLITIYVSKGGTLVAWPLAEFSLATPLVPTFNHNFLKANKNLPHWHLFQKIIQFEGCFWSFCNFFTV